MKPKLNYLLLIVCIVSLFSAASSYRMLVDSDASKVFNKQVYVQESATSYYFYTVYTQSNTISISILNQQVKTFQLSFKSTSQNNQLYFRDAYYKYIIVQQKNSTNNTVFYWVLQIVSAQQGYSLSSYSVNSRIDDQGFQMGDDYTLINIIQYNKENNFLYVTLRTSGDGITTNGDQDVYGIDLKNKPQRLITISWFYYSNPIRQTVIAGNSRVLVNADTDQMWFDTANDRTNTSDPTLFEKVNISSMTTYPIYAGGSRIYNFLGTAFQYVSFSWDNLNMTTFSYQGYAKTAVLGQGSLNSARPIRIYSDHQYYFIAVSDSDAYITTERWNSQTSSYQLYSTTASTLILDDKQRAGIVQLLYSALIVVYNSDQNLVYLLSGEYFYAFSPGVYDNIKVDQEISADSSHRDLETVLFRYINKYRATKN